MLVAVEILNARRGKPSLTARMPWLVAFSFGLLHGFGFAGALAEVGLPQHAIPSALLFFNIGVEMDSLSLSPQCCRSYRYYATRRPGYWSPRP
jgi:hypothetical protein